MAKQTEKRTAKGNVRLTPKQVSARLKAAGMHVVEPRSRAIPDPVKVPGLAKAYREAAGEDAAKR
jgi:hypothetical protein